MTDEDTILITKLARKYASDYNFNYKELLGSAWEGWDFAQRNYDHTKGVRKEYYTSLMISNYVRNYIKTAANKDKYEVSFEEVAEKHYSYENSNAIERLVDVFNILTSNEIEVIALLQEGNTQVEIAEILGVSQQAVSSRFKSIKKKPTR